MAGLEQNPEPQVSSSARPRPMLVNPLSDPASRDPKTLAGPRRANLPLLIWRGRGQWYLVAGLGRWVTHVHRSHKEMQPDQEIP